MPTAVIDASAAAALLFDEARAEEVAYSINGYDLIAPRLIRFEIISVGMKKIRSDPMLRQAVETGLLRFSALAIVENDVLLQSVLELAVATGLSAYDASYLWLARREDITLVTLDAQLANVALR